jgi:hypothetical protein
MRILLRAPTPLLGGQKIHKLFKLCFHNRVQIPVKSIKTLPGFWLDCLNFYVIIRPFEYDRQNSHDRP